MLDMEGMNLDTMDAHDLRGAGAAFSLLSQYAFTKANAVQAREDGRITEALRAEEACDRLYQALPEWARW